MGQHYSICPLASYSSSDGVTFLQELTRALVGQIYQILPTLLPCYFPHKCCIILPSLLATSTETTHDLHRHAADITGGECVATGALARLLYFVLNALVKKFIFITLPCDKDFCELLPWIPTWEKLPNSSVLTPAALKSQPRVPH